VSRSIPVALQADLSADTSTLTWCLRVDSTTVPGRQIFLTLLDEPFEFDDGDGAETYYPDPGYDPKLMESATDLSVDGTTFSALLQASGMMSEADLRAGTWDDAEVRVYRVNYEDPAAGHYELKRGHLGRLVIDRGLGLIAEIRGLAQDLRQTLCWRDSILCRARFGSQESEEREYCGFDLATIEVAFTVTSVGAENDRDFTAAGLTQDAGAFLPGVVRWTSGLNAGMRNNGVANHTAGGVISLRKSTRYPIQVGDVGIIRPDCDKSVEGGKGCRHYWDTAWVQHYRGEPHIPQGEGAQIPGAQVGPGAGGNTSVPDPSVEAA
jgi:uncharacterized phage protein (TIGR02218 family)